MFIRPFGSKDNGQLAGCDINDDDDDNSDKDEHADDQEELSDQLNKLIWASKKRKLLATILNHMLMPLR